MFTSGERNSLAADLAVQGGYSDWGLQPAALRTLRTIVAEACSRGDGPREITRSLHAVGIGGAPDVIAQTEWGEAIYRATWVIERRAWTPATRVHRLIPAWSCVRCKILYKMPGGMPRFYTVAEVEGADAIGINGRDKRRWHVRIGVTHQEAVGVWAEDYRGAFGAELLDRAHRERAPQFRHYWA